MDALGVWTTSWARVVFIESSKFWFYSLVFSLLGTGWQMLWICGRTEEMKPNASAESTKLGEKEPEAPSPGAKRSSQDARDEPESGPEDEALAVERYHTLVKNLIIQGCDILIPGSLVGWIDASPLVVSTATVASTILVGIDRWTTVRKQNQR